MARIRSVKPELRISTVVASWPKEVRYFWVLLWGYLDDYGRGLDAPKTIAGDCFPYDDDVTPQVADAWLDLMTQNDGGEQGPVCRYQANGRRYLHCVNWSEHQRPNRPTASRIPPCPIHEALTESLTEPLDVGAAAGSSRGAGEQRRDVSESRSEPQRAADTIAEKATGCTPTEARAIVDKIRTSKRNVRNLPGLVQTMADANDLPALLEEIRGPARRAEAEAATSRARDGPLCRHDQPSGEEPLPGSGEPRCPNCRRERRRAA